MDQPLPGGTAKIGCRRSIEEEKGKKKKRKRRKKKYLAAILACTRPRSPRVARATSPPSQPAGDYRPLAGREMRPQKEKKLIKARKVCVHRTVQKSLVAIEVSFPVCFSRHLHAMRRVRGCGGRFLNTKKECSGHGGNGGCNVKDGMPPRPATFARSEILQSDSLNLNSASSGSSASGSEVTSVYAQEDVDDFNIAEHLCPSVFHSHLIMMNGGQGTSTCGKWGAAADSCCDLLKV
ncbi:hypothetical protein GW17_00016384 [Ensete ventricosum]|nr:hypothetical protein GW17_00016384 [Ensete ventricosum]